MINTDFVKVEIWVWDQLKNHVKNEFSSEIEPSRAGSSEQQYAVSAGVEGMGSCGSCGKTDWFAV